MGAHTLGVDIGTTGTKTVLWNADTGIVAQTSRENTLSSGSAGWAEADPREWLDNVVSSIAELVSASGVEPVDIVAVSASGMVPAVVAVDADGEPLRRAILQSDARAGHEVALVRGTLDDLDVLGLTGSVITQQSVVPTLLWLRTHEPELWRRTHRITGSYDWVLEALGADPHVESNWGYESGVYTLGGELFRPAFDRFDLDPSVIPPLRAPGTVVGEVSTGIAAATGLRPGTRLVVGGADHVLSAYAAGVESPGDFLVKLGGAGDILTAAATPIVDARLYLDAHPIPGLWLPNGCMATSGSLIRWYQNLVGGSPLLELDAEAALARPADVLCLPYFLGEKSPLHDPDLRGAFVGLHLGHTHADLYRGVLEGIAFGFRHHVDVFGELGLPMTRGFITNGGSRSTLWKQIHAEVLGTVMRPIVDHPGASLGAAFLAGLAVGLVGDWRDLSAQRRLGDEVVPDPENVARYDDAYAQWRRLADAVAPTAHFLARRDR